MTVSTFFPDGDPEDTSVDGQAERIVGAGETWAAIRAGAGTGFFDSPASLSSPQLRADGLTDMWDIVARAFLLFDTAALPDGDAIDSATMDLVLISTVDDFGSQSVAMIATTPASNDGIVAADYAEVGTTRQASDRTIAGLTADSATYNAWTLNAAGLASIDAAGVTKFGLRIASEIDDIEPAWVATDRVNMTWACAEEVLGGEARPRLVVTHSAPLAPPVRGQVVGGQMAGNAPHSFRTRMVGT